MEIKAIMCDLDGTLLTSKGTVSEKTIQAIQEARKQGMLFGLSTGRDVHSVKALLDTWGIKEVTDAIVGTGGAELWDVTLNRQEASYPLDGRAIWEIIHHYEDMDVNFAIPYQGTLYTGKDDKHIRKLSEVDRIPYEVVDLQKFLEEPKPKVMLTFAPEMMEKVKKRSETFFSSSFKAAPLVTASVLFEYMDPRISKSRGLTTLMQWHGWTLENVCTFGDEDNDYDMTKHAGIGVVMKNGSEKTKSVADHITDDNDHDGIANFIYKHLL